MRGADFTFGFGSGIIFAAVILYLVYSFGFQDKTTVQPAQISDEDIIEQATKMGMIFFNELPDAEQPALMTNEEIIEHAYNLGMAFKEDEAIPEVSEEPETVPEPSEEPAPVIAATQPPAPVRQHRPGYVSVYIAPGTSASQIAGILQRNKIVDDSDKFLEYVINAAETKNLKNGYLWLPDNGSYEEVLESLRGRVASP